MANKTLNVQALRLEVQNLRGVRRINLPLDARNLVLAGENGSGKSSLVDALEYLFAGKIERLCRQDVKERESLPFLGCEGVEVALTCKVEGAESVFRAGYPYVEPGKGLAKTAQAWWKQVQARPPILRRAQILKFIEDKGADRYKQVSTLIGLDEVDTISTAWHSLKLDYQRQLKNSQQVVARKEQEAASLGILDRAKKLTLAGVNQRLDKLGLAPVMDVSEIPFRLASLGEDNAEATIAHQQSELSHRQVQLQSLLSKITLLNERYSAFYGACAEVMGARAMLKELLFHDLLAQSDRVLRADAGIEVCPVCQQPINRDYVLATLNQRMTDLAKIQQKKAQVQTHQHELSNILGDVLAGIAHVKPSVPEYLNALSEILVAIRALLQSGFESAFASLPDASPDPIADLQDDLQRVELELCALQPLEVHQSRIETAIFLQNVVQVWSEVIAARQQLSQTQKALSCLEMMEAALLEARKQRVDAVHAEIASTINDYYERLHPAEGYGEIDLPPERGGKGVGLRTKFHSIGNTHPLGFYSEGHLDSLGIAIFLAYVRHFNSNAGVLVLDDVMTTIDRNHRQKLAILLAEEFTDFQLILTTHDRFWAEQLLRTMRAYSMPTTALHLLPWNVTRGVEWQELLEYQWEEYTQRAATNPASAVADTGRDLEKFFSIMRYNLQLSIPARYDDRYTIGDLYPPFFAWFQKRIVQHPGRDFQVDLANLKKRFDVYWVLRNWSGAHYNEWGADLAPVEAQEFIGLVKDLVALLSCPKCDSVVAYDEKSSVLYCERCKGKKDGAFWQVLK